MKKHRIIPSSYSYIEFSDPNEYWMQKVKIIINNLKPNSPVKKLSNNISKYMKKPCENCIKKKVLNNHTKIYNIWGVKYILCDKCSELPVNKIK